MTDGKTLCLQNLGKLTKKDIQLLHRLKVVEFTQYVLAIFFQPIELL